MTHAQLITQIRAHLHDGTPLDAWELALESGDAVALELVRDHEPAWGVVTLAINGLGEWKGLARVPSPIRTVDVIRHHAPGAGKGEG